MLRRIHDQADHGRQFYLYRVQLVPTATVRKDWLNDPSNFVGDVILGRVAKGVIAVHRRVLALWHAERYLMRPGQ